MATPIDNENRTHPPSTVGMKRKFLLIRHKSPENQHENDEGGVSEEEEVVAGNEEEKHPPPPKKARLSTGTDEEEKIVDNCAQSVKTEPREEEEEQNGTQKIEFRDGQNGNGKESDVHKLAHPPIPSPTTTEVSTTSYPDNHPVPVSMSQCLHCASVKSFCIDVPVELVVYFRQAAENGAFQSLWQSVPNILVELDEAGRLLHVKSFSSAAIEKARMLADAFLESSRQRQQMLRKRDDNTKWSIANFESNMLNANFLVEIEVSLAYTGLAFGRNRSNLAAAREVYGVCEITVDESQKAQGICKFKIYANTAEAAEQARKMLEFTDRKVTVPANAIGRLIGKYSRNVKDIVNKSGVVRIFVDDEKSEDNSRKFMLIGTPETIVNAEMMLNFHLRHIRESNDLDEEREELERECFLETSSVVESSRYRNYDNSAFDHWTSIAPADSTAALSSGCRVNNNNRPPRAISGRGVHSRRNCDAVGVGRNGQHSTGTMPSGYYQTPLAGDFGCAEYNAGPKPYSSSSRHYGRRHSQHY
uniref:K Homology domain-containing protein n=1 Tax=Globodera rostochiensis TaxID=31243 RepID=A0A914GVX3_GLORO